MTNASAEPDQGRILCAHADQDGEGAHRLESGERCAQAITEEQIQTAAWKIQEQLALLEGRLADELLGRPEWGTTEWVDARGDQKTPEGKARLMEWHITKIRICRAAGMDPTGNVINLRKLGATWEHIGRLCGTSRQAAYDRWGKFFKDEAREKGAR